MLVLDYDFVFVFKVSYNGELYIFGGYNSHMERHFNDLWKFNPGKPIFNLFRFEKHLRLLQSAAAIVFIPSFKEVFKFHPESLTKCRK